MPSEHIDLTKGIVSILMFLFVTGLALSLFYSMHDNYSEELSSMQRASAAANIAPLYDLEDLSVSEKYPLVTVVADTLLAFDASDLLAITITSPVSTTTYSYASISNAIITEDPVGEAVRNLMQFSDCRCSVSVTENTYGLTTLSVTVRR